MYYENKLKKDMTEFERVRKILLETAYNKGMWECVRVSQILYLKIIQKRLDCYNEIIQECYEIIEKLKKADMIK